MNYGLENFKKNGVAFPFDLKEQTLATKNLESEYNNFQLEAQKKLGRRITLKPNLLSLFFDTLFYSRNSKQ